MKQKLIRAGENKHKKEHRVAHQENGFSNTPKKVTASSASGASQKNNSAKASDVTSKRSPGEITFLEKREWARSHLKTKPDNDRTYIPPGP